MHAIHTSLVLRVLTASALLCGCGSSAPTPTHSGGESVPPAELTAPPAQPEPEEATGANEVIESEGTIPGRRLVKLPSLSWTKTPKLADAPKKVAVANANGMGVEMGHARIACNNNGWNLEVGESEELPFEERQSVVVYFREAPTRGVEWSMPFDQPTNNRGFFQIKKAGDGPNESGTTSYNSPNAWAIEFTSWDVKPFQKDKDTFQTVGTAKGRVIVMHELGDGYKPSWVAGTFEAPVEISKSCPDLEKTK